MNFRLSLIAVVVALPFCMSAGPADAGHDAMQAGLAEQAAGRYARAVESFSRALATGTLSQTERVLALYDRGVARDALGQTLEAIEDYSEVLRLNAEFAPAFNNRGNAYRRLGRIEEATRDYLAAVKIPDAAHEYSYYGLGQIAEGQGDVKRARDYYRQALKSNPRFALVSRSLDALDKKSPPLRLGTVDRPQAEKQAKAPTPAAVPQAPQAKKSAEEQALEAKIAAAKREVARLKAAKPAPGGKTPGAAMVQLASFRTRAEVDAAWKRLAAKQGDLLKGVSPTVIEADLPKRGHFFRLRIAAGSMAQARELCAALKARGEDCLVVR